ncbi:MAG: 4Fe-4S binding protein [Deltaproteobacteria bacterium]|nr:4Fe-4S binding protein [Deltaproteobacteria bacterium]
MPRVEILSERCKGCGLCVQACPKGNLSLGQEFNAQGYAFACFGEEGGQCTGCAFCAELCPDTAIRVYKEKKRG